MFNTYFALIFTGVIFSALIIYSRVKWKTDTRKYNIPSILFVLNFFGGLPLLMLPFSDDPIMSGLLQVSFAYGVLAMTIVYFLQAKKEAEGKTAQ